MSEFETSSPNISETATQITTTSSVKFGRKLITEEERKSRSEQRKKEKEALERKDAAERKEAALNQMRYLLSVCEQYSEVYRKTITEQKVLKEKNRFAPTLEDVEDIRREMKKKPKQVKGFKDYDITKHLKYFEGGTLHPYQVEGVTWLYMLYANGSNGILADEMGLGKTIQIIALICVLMEQKVAGPFLIVAPLSTVPNWQSEFKRFAPKIPVIVVCGSAETRKQNLELVKNKYNVGRLETHPVVVVSYQTPLLEFNSLSRFRWKYIIVDEGHRIKNHNTQLSQNLRKFISESRLLLTGTPLQNNIVELWALLNFLLPNFFTNMNTFTELFMLEDMQNEAKLIQEEKSNNIISKIHKVLAPFMLRRLKKDVLTDMVPKKEVTVYCPLSPLQIKLYDYVIDRNIGALRGLTDDEKIDVDQPRKKRKCTINITNYCEPDEDDLEFTELKLDHTDIKADKSELKKYAVTLTRLTMQNPLMMFRKIVNHPYLVHFPLDPDSEKKQLLINEDLVNSSGKLNVLDTLLPELKKRGHKVLLFSQLCMGLDLIEEYLIMRNCNYRRLDGSYSLDERAMSIKDFNEDPDVFMFLLSTRAGGLGLNLTSADTVIFFDRDWNPQMDIQAQDRCHRIGQTKPVMIYSLISKNTIDEAIISTGKLKRVLERVVISDGKFKTITSDDKVKTEDMLVQLREALKKSNDEDSYIFSNNLELNRLLDRSDLYERMKSKKESLVQTDNKENEENKY